VNIILFIRSIMNHNTEQMTARLDNTIFNIQWDYPTTWAVNKSLCSIFFSLINDEFAPSECNYAEHVVTQNNIEVEVSLTSPSLDIPMYDFLLSSFQPLCVSNEEVLNPMLYGDTNTSIELSPPWLFSIVLMFWLIPVCGIACHDLAKRLSHYLFFFFFLDLLHKDGV